MEQNPTRKRFLAIITCCISILIGVVYLIIITILDSRGPMVPPPPEAFGEMGVVYTYSFSMVQLPFQMPCL